MHARHDIQPLVPYHIWLWHIVLKNGFLTLHHGSVYFLARSQDESDDNTQETLLVGYEHEQSYTHPPRG